jgi:HAD superfamily phosphatase (TIGR01668 family)
LGYKHLFFDYDNTLAPWRSLEVGAKTIALFNRLRENGFSICVITNASKKRAEDIKASIGSGIPVFGNMRKPGTKKLNGVLKDVGAIPSQSVLIGDLFFTDIVAGNRLKMLTFMINPNTVRYRNTQRKLLSFLQLFASYVPVFFYKVYFYTIGWFFRLTLLISPHEYCPDIFAIDYDMLASHDFNAIIFDLDNTLIPWKKKPLDAETVSLLKMLRNRGFKVFILSNSSNTQRITELKTQLGEGYIVEGKMMKPFPYRTREWLRRASQDPKGVVFAGDQLFTDVLCGNLLHLYTIKIEPLDRTYEFWATKVLRFLERKLTKFLHIKPKIKNASDKAIESKTPQVHRD